MVPMDTSASIYDTKSRPLAGRDLLSISDLTRKEIEEIFSVTDTFKKDPFGTHLKGKNIIMLFAKPSTRTRVSFEVAVNQLGGDDIYLETHDIQMNRGETIADTARVLSSYGDGIVARLFAHRDIQDLAAGADVPVINGLTDLHHPCQALTDLYTIREHFHSLTGRTVAFVGDGFNNVTHSLIQTCARLGVDIKIASPKSHQPDIDIAAEARAIGLSRVEVYEKPKDAVVGADVVYTDTWVSMGEEKEAAIRNKIFTPYQINEQLLAFAKPDAMIMHCLPAHRGFEITSELLDGASSLVWTQAANRLPVEKALLSLILKK